MRGFKGIATVVLLIGGVLGSRAQNMQGPIPNPSPNVLDGVYVQEHIPTKKVIPYEYLREADAIWSKRYWRSIDLREKMNLPLYYPHEEEDSEGNWVLNDRRWSLWYTIRHHIISGDLTVYSTYNPLQESIKDGDQFKYPVSPAPGKNYETDSLFRDELVRGNYIGKLGPEQTTALTSIVDGYDSLDVNGDPVYGERPIEWYSSKDIIQYRLKEDWFFDKERSQLDQRILGMAPVIYRIDDQGNVQGFKEIFWLYFPQCRYVFQNFFTYNTNNDSRWMSYDDLFWKREFTSTIYKQSNVYDRKIETFRHGIDALLESEKIKDEIFKLEHDVWSF
jgi:gliding motility associated protien GldN